MFLARGSFHRLFQFAKDDIKTSVAIVVNMDLVTRIPKSLKRVRENRGIDDPGTVMAVGVPLKSSLGILISQRFLSRNGNLHPINQCP
jgi:hypothetical protein